MKQIIFILIISGIGYSISAQINFEEPFNDLELSVPSDFFTHNQVRTIVEIENGFIYVNQETGGGEPFNSTIKKTNSNLEILDSIQYESLGLESLGIYVWGGYYDDISKITTLYGLDNGFFTHPTTFYKISINNEFEITGIKKLEYEEKIIDIREPVKNIDGGIIFLCKLTLSDNSNRIMLMKISNDFEMDNEVELPYGWSFTEGLTISEDGNIHIALSTNVVTYDSELNEIDAHEIEGLAQYEESCRYQRKTVNLPNDNLYFGGHCEEWYQDSISPWITIGEFQKERIFRYNATTQTFQSFFDYVPFGYDFDYYHLYPIRSFDALNPNCLYLGNNFFKADFYEPEYIFSINSIDSTGNLRWSKLYGSFEFYTLQEVIALKDEGVLLTIEGLFQDEATDIVTRNVYYLKLDKDGNIEGTTGIPGLTVYDNYIKISPNPATEYFKISNLQPWDKNTQINVVNALGQVVKTQQITHSSAQPIIEVSDWESGVYYVQFFNQEGLIDTQKVIVL